jgi:hypothetical protein
MSRRWLDSHPGDPLTPDVQTFLDDSQREYLSCHSFISEVQHRVDGLTPSTPSTPNIQHTLGSNTPISAFIWGYRCIDDIAGTPK